MKKLKIIILLGMSGAGKSTVMRAFEDLEFMCIDNMPPYLVPDLAKKLYEDDQISHVTFELNAKYYPIESIFNAIDEMMETENYEIHKLFLDASDESLISRYKEARRVHPYESTNRGLTDAIASERAIMLEYRNWKRVRIIDTSDLSAKELTKTIKELFSSNEKQLFAVNFMSFGFKHGMPHDADYVIDVRYLPNPFYLAQLKALSGMDDPVFDYVFSFEDSNILYKKIIDLLDVVLKGLQKERRNQVVIAIGCTGGQHRSVSFARRLERHFSKTYATQLYNRDISKNKVH